MLIKRIEQSNHANRALLPSLALDYGSFVVHSIRGMLLVFGKDWDHVLLCKEIRDHGLYRSVRLKSGGGVA
jgi:hypothetical protein